MSPVTPKPAAEFSTLAMTKSIDSLLDERGHGAARDLASGLAEDVADEQDPHGQSVRTGIRIWRAAALLDARQHARAARRRAAWRRHAPASKAPANPHRAGELPEGALGKVEGGARDARSPAAACGRMMTSAFPHEHDRHLGDRNARQVDHDLDPVRCLEDVEGRVQSGARSVLVRSRAKVR